MKKKSWIVEESGVRLRVHLVGSTWWIDARGINGNRTRQSLRTQDRGTADANARELAREIARQQLLGVRPETLTLDELFSAYNRHRLPLQTDGYQKSIRAMQRMFRAAWGGGLILRTLSQQHVEHFCTERRTGRLSPMGQWEDDRGVTKGRAPVRVRDATLANDFRWLSSALNFATDFDVNGTPLLARNPLRRLRMPSEKNPRRPVASHARFVRTLEHADAVDPAGRLRCGLALVRYTGRRINAVCQLRVSDVLLTPDRLRTVLAATGRDESLADAWTAGAIRWRPENDKLGFDELAPLSEPARAAIEHYLRTYAAIGEAPLLPAPGHPYKPKPVEVRPVNVHLMADWLMRAERLAGLPKLAHGRWHPYRRLWAVERKHLPDVDVARAGGWRDTRALKVSYQQPDPLTMLRVVDSIGSG